MKKNLTELVFILDRSGSMAGLEADTIGGFNAMIEKQRNEPGEAFVSTVLFDHCSEVIHDRVSLSKLPKLTEKDYYVRGCTALLDAVGSAISHIGNVHKYAREDDRPEKTLFVITTAGMENATAYLPELTSFSSSAVPRIPPMKSISLLVRGSAILSMGARTNS